MKMTVICLILVSLFAVHDLLTYFGNNLDHKTQVGQRFNTKNTEYGSNTCRPWLVNP